MDEKGESESASPPCSYKDNLVATKVEGQDRNSLQRHSADE